MIDQVRASMTVAPEDFISDDKPSLANHVATYQGAPKNIVILLMESHGARYVKSLGGIDVSPNMDKLINEAGHSLACTLRVLALYVVLKQ